MNSVPRINRWTGGRALVVAVGLMSLGMALAVVAAEVTDPVLAFVVAIVLSITYGICAIAAPNDLAGITGVYYWLAYSGFLLPTVVAVNWSSPRRHSGRRPRGRRAHVR